MLSIAQQLVDVIGVGGRKNMKNPECKYSCQEDVDCDDCRYGSLCPNAK